MSAPFAHALLTACVHASFFYGVPANGTKAQLSEAPKGSCDAPLATSWVKITHSDVDPNMQHTVSVQQQWLDTAEGILLATSNSCFNSSNQTLIWGIGVATGEERWKMALPASCTASTKVGRIYQSRAPVLHSLQMDMLDVKTGSLLDNFEVVDACTAVHNDFFFPLKATCECEATVQSISNTAGLVVIDFFVKESWSADGTTALGFHMYQALSMDTTKGQFADLLWSSSWKDPFSGYCAFSGCPDADEDSWSSYASNTLVLLSDSTENVLVSLNDHNHFWRLNASTGAILNDFFLGGPVRVEQYFKSTFYGPTFKYVTLSPDGMLLVGLGGTQFGSGYGKSFHDTHFNFTFGLWTIRVDCDHCAGRRAFVFPIWAGIDDSDGVDINRLHWAEDGDLYVTMHFGVYRLHVNTSSGEMSQVSASVMMKPSSDLTSLNSSRSWPYLNYSAASPDGRIFGWGNSSSLYQWAPTLSLFREQHAWEWDGMYQGIWPFTFWPFSWSKTWPESVVHPFRAVVVDVTRNLVIIPVYGHQWYLFAFDMGCGAQKHDNANLYFWCSVIAGLCVGVAVVVVRKVRQRRAKARCGWADTHSLVVNMANN